MKTDPNLHPSPDAGSTDPVGLAVHGIAGEMGLRTLRDMLSAEPRS
jgi:hypothetical protein